MRGPGSYLFLERERQHHERVVSATYYLSKVSTAAGRFLSQCK